MSENETDRLQYKGYKIPIAVIIPWVILLIWCAVYLVRHMLPDLQHWL